MYQRAKRIAVMLGLHREMHVHFTSRHESTPVEIRISEEWRLVVPQCIDDPRSHKTAVLCRESRKLVQGRLSGCPLFS